MHEPTERPLKDISQAEPKGGYISYLARYISGNKIVVVCVWVIDATICCILQDENLGSVEVLQMLNGLVACGELPSLFSNDEMDGLLQVGIEVWITKCMNNQRTTSPL